MQSIISFSQENKKNKFSLTASTGYNVHSLTKNYQGWYIKLGGEYKIWKGLSGAIRLWHSNVDEFPSRFKTVPFSADDETNFIRNFIGISEKDWYPPRYKGIYNIIQAHIASISLGYEFRIKKKFFITPHYSFNLVRSKYIAVGLYEASFSNLLILLHAAQLCNSEPNH